jgi:PAS domain S-box-containing protein
LEQSQQRLVEQARRVRARLADLDAEESDHLEAAREIQKLSQFQETVIDNANVWLDVLDENCNVLIWNRAAERLSGYSREEVVGHDRIWEWVYPDEDYRREVRSAVCAMIRDGDFVEDDRSTITCKDGRTRVIRWSGECVEDESGRRLGAVFFGRDVTEERESAATLSAAEERFSRMGEESSDAVSICVWDPISHKRCLAYCNDRYVAMSGYSREELERAEDLNELLTPRVSSEQRARWRQRMLKGLPCTGVSSWKRPDGRENHYEWSCICAKVGDEYLVFGADRDITDQKQAEEALRESERRFRLLVETAFDGISICERVPGPHRLLCCNDRYVQISGRSREEVESAGDLNDLISQHCPEDEFRRWHARAREGRPFSGLSSWKCPDGRERLFEWSSIWIKGGQHYRTFSVDREVSDEGRFQELLKDSAKRITLPFSPQREGFGVWSVQDESGRMAPLFCSDRLVQMSGHPRERFEQGEDADWLLFQPAPGWEEPRWPEAAAAGLPLCGLSTGRQPDGGEVVTEWCGVWLRGPGEPFLFSVHREASEPDRAEKLLRGDARPAAFPFDPAVCGMSLRVVRKDKRRLLFCNDRWVEMSGLTREELEAAGDLNEFTVDYASPEQVRQWHDRAIGGLAYSGVASWKRPDGKENYYEWSTREVKVGDRYRLFSVDRDITGRVRAQRALNASREEHRALLESLSVGVYRIAGEEEGRFVVANEALARIHGYASAEELLDVPVVELYEDPEDRRRLIEELRRKGQVRNREVRARRKDGTSVWTSVTVSVRYGADGEIKWLDGISEDITERKGAREALRESEARFQRLSDATFEGIVVHRKREIVDASSAFAGMFGYEIDELVGMDGVGLLVPEQRETVMAILESGQTEPYETIGLRKDGTTFPMEVQAREMQWAGETVRVAAVRDITERKRAEEALRESEERHRAIVEDQSELLNRYTPDFHLPLFRPQPRGAARKELHALHP